jgi:hypothetical protein
MHCASASVDALGRATRSSQPQLQSLGGLALIETGRGPEIANRYHQAGTAVYLRDAVRQSPGCSAVRTQKSMLLSVAY